MATPTPTSVWPLGLNHELATIDAAAIREHLEAKLAFRRDHDDLDGFVYAVFEVIGEPFALQLYDNIPSKDFTLLTTATDLGDDESLAAFLDWSGVPRTAVRWVRPSDAAFPSP